MLGEEVAGEARQPHPAGEDDAQDSAAPCSCHPSAGDPVSRMAAMVTNIANRPVQHPAAARSAARFLYDGLVPELWRWIEVKPARITNLDAVAEQVEKAALELVPELERTPEDDLERQT